MSTKSFARAAALCGTLITAALVSADAAPNTPEPGNFVREFYAAYSAKDGTKMAEFYTADASFTDPTFELDLHGREAIGSLLNKVLAKYDSLEHEIKRTLVAGDDLIIDGVMIGQLGAKTVRVPYVSMFHFIGGKIASQRDMFDTLHYLVQLGAIASPFAAKPPAATPSSSPAA